ncbi:unnamed protein product [Musa hybrid cultivar]
MHAPTRTLHRRSGSAGGATPREGSRPLASLCLPGFRTRRLARMSDSLVRVSRRVGWGAHWPMPRSRVCPAGHADGARHVLDRIDGIPSNERSVRASPSMQPASIRTPSRCGGPANRRSASDRGASPAPIRFPPGNFKHSLTLFSKSFSSFPRGTCSLSVSRHISLGRNLPPDWGCIPKQPDSSTAPRGATGSEPDGALTLPGALSRGLGPGPSLRTLLQTTIQTTQPPDSQAGLIPVRSPLLRESS